MSPRILVILVLACVIVFGMVFQPDAMTEPPAMISEPTAAQREYRERFFGGDPDRDVRGGQEMKSGW
ncbi:MULTISPECIES: entry exclusion protein TrbK [unclassified Phyllobacterium]|uniref:entry exclusion protein TrbK n=1 Tax=unclassified Phyllobacterium TaxID=2638441 RepID=UPI003012CD3C